MASIPVPQLRPLEQPDVASNLAQLVGLRNAVQQGNIQQEQLKGIGIENQSRQIGLNSQKALLSAYQKLGANADPDEIAKTAMESGADPSHVSAWRKGIAESAEAVAKANGEVQKNYFAGQEHVSGVIAGALDLPPEQRLPALQQTISGMVQGGGISKEDGARMLKSLPQDPQQLDTFLRFHGLSSMTAQEQAKLALEKQNAESAQIQAGARNLQAQTGSQRLQMEQPGGPLDPMNVSRFVQGQENKRTQYIQGQENARAANKKSDAATQAEKNRADLGQNLNENLDALEEIVKRRPDLFGPVAGRWTGLKAAVGTNDADIGALKTIEHQLGMVQQSTHGMRSAHGVQAAADSIVQNFRTGPEALLGAIQAARKSSATFLSNADPGTSGSGNQSGSLPRGGGRFIDKATAQQFYQAAGGDPNKARKLAVQSGWKVQ